MSAAPKEWVRVSQIKGKLMCSTCGRRSFRFKPERTRERLENWCEDLDKPCSSAARHCEGAFIREDKVKKVLKEWETLYDE
jgi:hypothetical protein